MKTYVDCCRCRNFTGHTCYRKTRDNIITVCIDIINVFGQQHWDENHYFRDTLYIQSLPGNE